MTSFELSDRTGRILSLLVREYIETGEPVGSLALAERGGLGLSSATVRNILAQLEEHGYVRQPHTSAGRVPTDRGYRFYVDRLLRDSRPIRTTMAVEARLRRDAGSPPLVDEVLTTVSHVLSRSSRHVGFALPPADEAAVFHQIEFVSLTGSKILVILITRGGQITEKLVDVGEPMEPEELHQAARYLNTEFAGLSLLRARSAVVARLREEQTLYNRLFSRALRLAQSSFEEPPRHPSLFVEGASSLVEQTAHHDSGITMATLRALVRMVEEKQRLVRILNEYIDGQALTIVIGGEHTSPDLRPFSLVAATYFDGQTTGTVGVLGPTRMRYSRAIAVVEGVAQAVSRVLGGSP